MLFSILRKLSLNGKLDIIDSDGKTHSFGTFPDLTSDNLYSKIRLGQLVDYDWWHIDGKIFLEIIIPSAKAPVFYKHLYKTEPDKGKEIMFNLTYKEGHTEMKGPSKKLDEFFVREGSHKSPITTFEEYTAYYNTHFI